MQNIYATAMQNSTNINSNNHEMEHGIDWEWREKTKNERKKERNIILSTLLSPSIAIECKTYIDCKLMLH